MSLTKTSVVFALAAIVLLVPLYLRQYRSEHRQPSFLGAGREFQKVPLDPSLGSLCLDGSQYSYYFSPGLGDNSNKWIIFFQGGGWCAWDTLESTLDSCLGRSSSSIGSSKQWPMTLNWGQGILSNDPVQNPEFNTWSKIYMPQCDGTGHQGYKKDPVEYKGQKLWFRGGVNVRESFKNILKNSQLMNAETVMITGSSAGGLATYNWANYVRDMMPAKAKVVAVPDSGFFLDFPNLQTKNFRYRNWFKNFMTFSNAEENPVHWECVRDNPQEKWKCMLPEYIVSYLKVPTFFVQSAYDSWSIPNIVGTGCINGGTLKNCKGEERNQIEAHRDVMVAKIQKILSERKDWGAWLTACVDHVYDEGGAFNHPDYNVPMRSGYTSMKALSDWIKGAQDPYNYRHIDDKWPSNVPCARQ